MTREQKTRFLLEDFVRRFAPPGHLAPKADVYSAAAETFQEILSAWAPQLGAGEAPDLREAAEALFELHQFLQDGSASAGEEDAEWRWGCDC